VISQATESTVIELLVTDELSELLEMRIAALEEVMAARWPRRLVLAGRLRRRLRASVAGYTGDFFASRAEDQTGQFLEGKNWIRKYGKAVPPQPD
jgi:hypothetical protein